MGPAQAILVVDDDASVGRILAAQLTQEHFQATWVGSAEAALALLEKKPFDLVISDVRMPGLSGMELLRILQARQPDLPVILLTAHGSVPMAVEAMREGAADFLLKPWNREELLFLVKKVLQGSEAERAAPPRASRANVESTDGMIGRSASLESARDIIRKAAPSTSAVLILGETGTGKELVARALHALSPRKSKPFVRVNCGALPEHLFESEVFGYEKGAFTGAVARKPGRVELAEQGTLFFDEVGELPLTAQVKLLRLLQEKEYERLGGTQTLKADVRILSATHRALGDMVAAGTFREDLFYRLNVLSITLAPLRERPEDIEGLTRHFLAMLGAQNGRPTVSLSPDAMAMLVGQPWKGNVRQLQNFVESLVVMAPPGDVIDAAATAAELARKGLDAKTAPTPAPSETLPERRMDAERHAVEEALAKAGGNRSLAARILGVSRRTLYNKLEMFEAAAGPA